MLAIAVPSSAEPGTRRRRCAGCGYRRRSWIARHRGLGRRGRRGSIPMQRSKRMRRFDRLVRRGIHREAARGSQRCAEDERSANKPGIARAWGAQTMADLSRRGMPTQPRPERRQKPAHDRRRHRRPRPHRRAAARPAQRRQGLASAAVLVTRLIDVGDARPAGSVLILAGAGFQAASLEQLPSAHLYHSVAALNRTGQGFAARMIAAEALART